MFSFSASFTCLCLSSSSVDLALFLSFLCVRSAPGGGGSGRAGVAAVLCGLRLGDPGGAPVSLIPSYIPDREISSAKT